MLIKFKVANKCVIIYVSMDLQVLNLINDIRAAGSSTALDLTSKLHRVTNSIVSRAAFGMKSRKADDFLAAIHQSFIYCSGFQIPDLFPSFTGILSFLTGMERKLQSIHETIDGILEDIISEREAILNHGSANQATATEKNLVEVLLSLQGSGDFGFPITRNTIKAVILVSLSPKIFTSRISVSHVYIYDLLNHVSFCCLIYARMYRICLLVGQRHLDLHWNGQWQSSSTILW
jgi:hypothetical protein